MDYYDGPIGVNARMEYYDIHKEMIKLVRINNYEKLDPSPDMFYL
jgi:hypothetical protein